MQRISKVVKFVKSRGLYPDLPTVECAHKPKVVVNGNEVLMFASNNYLDLLHDERVVGAAIKGVQRWGIGTGSSRLFTGNLEICELIDREIAKFKNKEAGVTFVAGWMANTGSIPAIVDVTDVSLLSQIRSITGKKKKPDTVIFSDEYNHASVVVGCRLSRADREVFRHNDMSDLESKLKVYSKARRKLILVDGVFSMDGDITPLPDVLYLAKKYNALVYLDDAHASGVLGKHGRGTEDHFNVEGQVDIVMGTFTKVFGGVGGFVVGSQDLIDYLKISAKTFIFTAPIPPPTACGLVESIRIVQSEPWRREKLLNNAKYLRESLLNLGFDICGSQTQIIPVLIGEEKKTIEAGRMLMKNKIFAPNARFPAVPKGKARLRFTVMSSHTKEQIDYLISTMKTIKENL